MIETLRNVIQANGLIVAFLVVGLAVWLSYWASRQFTRGRIHGSAIAIILGLLAAYAAGLATDGSRGVADIGLLAGSAGTATIGDCSIAIYAGHGFLNSAFDDDGKLKNPKATDRLNYPHLLKGSPKCSGGAIIACNAAKFASIQNPIPGVSLNDGEISVLQGIGQIDGAVGSAQAFAKSIGENCACEKVTITVNCFPPFHKPGIFSSGSKWCGKTITVPCPCKVKK